LGVPGRGHPIEKKQMKELWLDTETYNAVTDIRDGTLNYAATADITLAGWAIDDEPATVWDRTEDGPMPVRLYDAMADANVIIKCHNAFFDRHVLLTSDMCDVPLGIERFYCTMVQAHAHGLPGGLDVLCQIFGIGADKAKLKEGKDLVRFFCKPDKNGKRNTRLTHPEKWAKFVDYCRLDVEAMRAVSRLMPKHNYPDDPNHPERRLWFIDQATNDRGFAVDMEFAESAVAMADRLKLDADAAIFDETNGEVGSSTQVAVLREYLKNNFGIDLPDLTASTVERRLADPNIPEPVKQLLAMRAETSKTSVKKYSTLLRLADSRGRLGGTLQFCGASRTGRDAGRGFQPQNLPRPPKWISEEDIEMGIDACKNGMLDLVYDKPMALLGSAVRGAIIAPEGYKLCISDLSNIEGRGLVWLSGEEWKLNYFRDFDAGKIAFDNYVAAYAKGMGVPLEDVTSDQRQTGKVQELACGYGGGVGGFLTFATAYNMDLNRFAEQTERNADSSLWHDTLRKYDWAVKNKFDYNLPKYQWAACDYAKTTWRMGHPETVQWWGECEQAFRMAVAAPGVWHAARRVALKRVGQWLYAKLPSGRVLCYLQPRVDEKGCSYMGLNQYTRKWSRIRTYGGKLAENFTQAVARDILMYNMPAIEERGYAIVMRVHDELLTETPDTDSYTAGELSQLMSTTQPWCASIPLAAKGFETTRYRKD